MSLIDGNDSRNRSKHALVAGGWWSKADGPIQGERLAKRQVQVGAAEVTRIGRSSIGFRLRIGSDDQSHVPLPPRSRCRAGKSHLASEGPRLSRHRIVNRLEDAKGLVRWLLRDRDSGQP